MLALRGGLSNYQRGDLGRALVGRAQRAHRRLLSDGTGTSAPVSASTSRAVPLRRTGLSYDSKMLLHAQEDHPECPERLISVVAKLKESNQWDKCLLMPSRFATRDEILTVHSLDHYNTVMSIAQYCQLDGQTYNFEGEGDTYANKYSAEAALLSAGGTIQLTEQVVKGHLDNGFSVVRPPGHHASANRIMGFCLFNNVAIAAQVALKQLGIQRVLIVDWDVHHGNGTQNIFYENDNVLYFSVHKGGWFYPFTGHLEEVGEGNAVGRTVNVPFLHNFMGDADYHTCFKHVLLPITKAFDPSLILVSAGFDCARGDPLANMAVTRRGFKAMLKLLTEFTGGTRIVCVLEGGYNIENVGWGVTDCVSVLRQADNKDSTNEEEQTEWRDDPTSFGLEDIGNAIRVQSNYWKCMKDKDTKDDEWRELNHRLLFSGAL